MPNRKQRQFLAHHQIRRSKLFDAKGAPPRVYGPAMERRGSLLAYNVKPCRNHGHRLRNRHGQCVKCYPRFLRFKARHRSGGIVYVAHSTGTRVGRRHLVKVGVTYDISVRHESLNGDAYGGKRDWRIVLQRQVPTDAGRLESEIHAKLERYAIGLPYMKAKGIVTTRETFVLNVDRALAVVVDILGASASGPDKSQDV